jgi:hypothetical protein
MQFQAPSRFFFLLIKLTWLRRGREWFLVVGFYFFPSPKS